MHIEDIKIHEIKKKKIHDIKSLVLESLANKKDKIKRGIIQHTRREHPKANKKR